MAKALGAKSAPNVVKLPARAAKGAAGSKPKPAPKKLASSIPASKRPAPKTEENLRESLALQLVGYTAQHRSVDAEISVLKEELKSIMARKKQIRTAILTAGMPLNLFDEAYEDAGTSRVDLDQKEKLRAIVREALGLAVAQQRDFLEGIADPAKPEVYWEAQGYQDGIGGKFAKAPDNCPPENHQNYLKGHAQAMARNAAGIKVAKAAMEAQAAKKPAEAPAEAAPDDAAGATETPKTEEPGSDGDEDEDGIIDGENGSTDPELDAAPSPELMH